jgi:DNA-binding LacI/PurR family transcriptional regulator
MVTKAQIAEAAGVSRTCVSLVLNDRPGVRVAVPTRRRVLEVARRLGYPANAPVRTTGRSKSLRSVAYVLASGAQPASRMGWHFGVLDEMQRCLVDDGRSLLFFSCNDAAASHTKLLRVLDNSEPLGVILDGTVPVPLVEAIQKRHWPFVVTGITPFAHDPQWLGKVNTVSVDVKESVHRSMRWLAEHGARSIALASDELNLMVSRMILQAYQETVRELDLSYDPALVQVCSRDVDGRHLMARFGELNVKYDGLLIGSLPLARAILSWSTERRGADGLPPLVAAIGPGGVEAPVPPDVASAFVDSAGYARLAYDLLVQQINYPQRKPENLELAMTFNDPTRA